MSPTTTDPRKLVMTEAEPAPPPGPTVPEPRIEGADARAPRDSAGRDTAALREVKQLADRLGGLERLQELLNVLRDLRQ